MLLHFDMLMLTLSGMYVCFFACLPLGLMDHGRWIFRAECLFFEAPMPQVFFLLRPSNNIFRLCQLVRLLCAIRMPLNVDRIFAAFLRVRVFENLLIRTSDLLLVPEG